jgi:hypothetical protein
MNETPPRAIVITKEDLADLRVDEVLDYQRSYTPTPVEAPPPKFRLIYSAWFYLMIAGALGALAAWAIIEPNFRDQIRFTGKISALEPDAPGPFSGARVEIRGHLSVAGIDVYVAPEMTTIRAANAKSKLSARELSVGDVVTVFGVTTPRPSTMLATGIRVEGPHAPVDSLVNLSSLSFQQGLFAFLLFPVVAGLIGLTIGGVEGVVCRTYSRAAWCAAIGLLAGLIGGAISHFVAGLIYGLLGLINSDADPTKNVTAFIFQMFRRGLGWTVAGMTMGLGQGFALKSSKLKLNGFIGGMVGGLVGGLLFDPISLMFGSDGLSNGSLSRAIGIVVIGATVGAMIGFTDLLTRDAWLKVLTGPLQGKEFSFSVTPVRIGSSQKNEIYLFKDSKVQPVHAEINKLRDAYEIVDNSSETGTFVNGQPVSRIRLTDGAHIRIGDSEFSFSSREKAAK